MPKKYSQAPAMQIDPTKQYAAVFHTDKGDFTAELYAKEAPITVNNFVFLAQDHYYDGVTFHRVIPGFMAQTGDPTGTGMGGPGYTIVDEKGGLNLKHDAGILSMAKSSAPNSGGSQFFIVYSRQSTKHLDGVHAVFGKITAGMDIVNAIRERDPNDRQPGDKINSIDIITS